MAAQYFVHKDGKRHDLNDMEDLLSHIKNVQRGELFLTSHSGIKIGYDTKTGHAQPLSALETGLVRNSYAHELFHQSVQPVSLIMRELAKLNLLLELLELKDPVISGIIFQRHMQNETGELTNTKEIVLDDTLYKIQQRLAPTLSSAFFNARDTRTPLQRAVYDVLANIQLDSIRSEMAVESIMTRIEDKLANVRNENIANSSDFSNSKQKHKKS